MKIIPLTQGQVALVDDSDFEFLSQWNWCAQKCRRTFYAVRTVWNIDKKSRGIKMHRLLTNAPDGIEVDHENGIGTDNQRHNLRLATRLQNSHHQRKSRSNTSGFVGAYKMGNRWKASIGVLGKPKYLGMFSSAEEAAKARDEAALKYFGEFAILNFPKSSTI